MLLRPWLAAPQILKNPNAELWEWNTVICSALLIQTDYSSSSNLWILFKLAVTFFAMPLPRPENPQAFWNYLTRGCPTPRSPHRQALPGLSLVCASAAGGRFLNRLWNVLTSLSASEAGWRRMFQSRSGAHVVYWRLNPPAVNHLQRP